MRGTDDQLPGSAAAASSALERRQFSRVQFDEKVTILWAGPSITGAVRDICDRGMSLSVERADGPASRFAKGTRLRLLFQAPESEGNRQPVNVIGEVVRVSEDDQLGRIVVAVAFEPL